MLVYISPQPLYIVLFIRVMKEWKSKSYGPSGGSGLLTALHYNNNNNNSKGLYVIKN